MDQARQVLVANLARNAEAARKRMAFDLASVSRLTKINILKLEMIERGEENVGLTLDELVALALFLGLTATGGLRSKHPGSDFQSDDPPVKL